MRDDFLARDYADHHRTLSHSIHKLIHRAAIAFEALARYQYAAPWHADRGSGTTVARSRAIV